MRALISRLEKLEAQMAPVGGDNAFSCIVRKIVRPESDQGYLTGYRVDRDPPILIEREPGETEEAMLSRAVEALRASAMPRGKLDRLTEVRVYGAH